MTDWTDFRGGCYPECSVRVRFKFTFVSLMELTLFLMIHLILSVKSTDYLTVFIFSYDLFKITGERALAVWVRQMTACARFWICMNLMRHSDD